MKMKAKTKAASPAKTASAGKKPVIPREPLEAMSIGTAIDHDVFVADAIDYVTAGQWPQFLIWMEKERGYKEHEVERAIEGLRAKAGRVT